MTEDERLGKPISRRALLGGALAAGTGMALGARVEGGPEAPRPLPTRPFGKTGRTVTAFGLGCYYVGAAGSDKEGVAVVRRALDLGCTYFDTAPSYVRGVSERRVGLGLEGRRKDVFLSTKTLERSASGAMSDVEESLRRLRTDARGHGPGPLRPHDGRSRRRCSPRTAPSRRCVARRSRASCASSA